jgi:hypothetical protein
MVGDKAAATRQMKPKSEQSCHGNEPLLDHLGGHKGCRTSSAKISIDRSVGMDSIRGGTMVLNRMRFNYCSPSKAGRRALLALILLATSACTEIALPSEAATPPADQPAYAALAAKYFSSTMADRTSFENFEISALRWVHALKGWSWLACVHFVDRGHLRTYALFIQNDAVIDARYAVQSDSCGSQSYTPFDIVTGVLGRPTSPQQPALY